MIEKKQKKVREKKIVQHEEARIEFEPKCVQSSWSNFLKKRSSMLMKTDKTKTFDLSEAVEVELERAYFFELEASKGI